MECTLGFCCRFGKCWEDQFHHYHLSFLWQSLPTVLQYLCTVIITPIMKNPLWLPQLRAFISWTSLMIILVIRIQSWILQQLVCFFRLKQWWSLFTFDTSNEDIMFSIAMNCFVHFEGNLKSLKNITFNKMASPDGTLVNMSPITCSTPANSSNL